MKNTSGSKFTLFNLSGGCAYSAHRDGCLCPVMNLPFIHGPYSLPASLVNDAVECKISLHSDYNFPDTTTDLRNWSWKAGSFLVLVTDCGKFLFGHLMQMSV